MNLKKYILMAIFSTERTQNYIFYVCAKGVVQKDIVIWGLATMLPDGQKYLKLMLDN